MRRPILIVSATLIAALAYSGTVPVSAATGHNVTAAKPPSISPTEDGWRVARSTGANSTESLGTWVYAPIDPGVTSCPEEAFCIWEGLNYTGRGVAIGGIWGRCEAFSWQGSRWENHVYSLKNNATGGVSVWNRRPVVELIYDWLYDLVPGAYSGDFPAGRKADLMAYDPSYTCTEFPRIYTF